MTMQGETGTAGSMTDRFKLMLNLQRLIAKHQTAPLVDGMLLRGEQDGTGDSAILSMVDCATSDLIALADALLLRAFERLGAAAKAGVDVEQQLIWIERARNELGVGMGTRRDHA